MITKPPTTIEMVDVRTLVAHRLTPDAAAAGRLPAGRYIALCGADLLPTSLTDPGRGRCTSCFAPPARS